MNATGRPFAAPCVLVRGGETVTWIREHDRITGRGGPSQELALGFALAACGIPGAALYAMDSEGTDGTSPAAGALVDSTTADRARALGVDLRAHLRRHSSYEALSKVGDAVRTGNTGRCSPASPPGRPVWADRTGTSHRHAIPASCSP